MSESHRTTCPLAVLHPDVLFHIFEFLSLREWIRCERVCSCLLHGVRHMWTRRQRLDLHYGGVNLSAVLQRAGTYLRQLLLFDVHESELAQLGRLCPLLELIHLRQVIKNKSSCAVPLVTGLYQLRSISCGPLVSADVTEALVRANQLTLEYLHIRVLSCAILSTMWCPNIRELCISGVCLCNLISALCACDATQLCSLTLLLTCEHVCCDNEYVAPQVAAACLSHLQELHIKPVDSPVSCARRWCWNCWPQSIHTLIVPLVESLQKLHRVSLHGLAAQPSVIRALSTRSAVCLTELELGLTDCESTAAALLELRNLGSLRTLSLQPAAAALMLSVPLPPSLESLRLTPAATLDRIELETLVESVLTPQLQLLHLAGKPAPRATKLQGAIARRSNSKTALTIKLDCAPIGRRLPVELLVNKCVVLQVVKS